MKKSFIFFIKTLFTSNIFAKAYSNIYDGNFLKNSLFRKLFLQKIVLQAPPILLFYKKQNFLLKKSDSEAESE